MHSVGIDIIEIERIQEAIDRWGHSFLHRIYTASELTLCHGKTEALAVRFAAKEAVMKALGTGIKGISWREIEVMAEPGGKPLVHLYDKARTKAAELGLGNLAISLSHSREYAVAFIVSEVK